MRPTSPSPTFKESCAGTSFPRDPFPYETDPDALRHCFVPDPFAPAAWSRLRCAWETSGNGNFLAWLLQSGQLKLTDLARLLCDFTGAPWVQAPEPLAPDSGDASARLLRSQGLIPLEHHAEDGRCQVAGGTCIPVDLHPILGTRASDWQWVLIPPYAQAVDASNRPLSSSAQEAPGSSTQLPGWLASVLERGATTLQAEIHFERFHETLSMRLKSPSGTQLIGRREGEEAVASLRLLRRLAGFSTSAMPMPEDGHLRTRIGAAQLTFRISAIRAAQSESLVLRPACVPGKLASPEALGIPLALQTLFLRVLCEDPGLVVFAGSTGSGKTTTLFSLLKMAAGEGLKILTIEDPVEHELPEATQTQVNDKRNWNHETALKAFLRQDPDIIVVGELRDAPSARGALRAALTGHTVLTTLHAGKITDASARLRGWGLEEGILSESLRLTTHQEWPPARDGESPCPEFTWATGLPNPADSQRMGSFTRAPCRQSLEPS